LKVVFNFKLPVIVSIAAHGALFVVLARSGLPAHASRGPVTVEILPSKQPIATPVVQAPRAAAPLSRPRRTTPPSLALARDVPRATPPAAPMQVAAVDDGSASGDDVVVPAPAPGAPSGTGAPAPGPVRSSAPVGASAGSGTFDLSGYVSALGGAVARHRRYPDMAAQMGQEGVVEVIVRVRKDGSLASPPSVKSSSGFDLLDSEALRMVARAAPFPALPGAYGGAVAELRVPVRFHLEN
jgi:protein TonB